MLYEEFEKLNCQHIKILEQQNASIRNVQNIDTSIQPIQCLDSSRENLLLRNQFHVNQSCIKRDNNTDTLELCNGFDCSTQYFYQTPDKFNTFHNYLVLQDEKPVVCTNNHQYYNNWTRRKIPVHPKDSVNNVDFLDEYFEPIPKLKMNKCDVNDTRYFC